MATALQPSVTAGKRRDATDLPPTQRIQPRHLAAAAGMLAVAVAVQHAAWSDIMRIAWSDQDSSHILLVPVVLAWVALVRRSRLRDCRLRGQWWGAGVVLAGVLISHYGVHHAMQVFWHIGTVLIAAGAVLAVLGTDVLKKFFPVFLLAGFFVPVPATIRQALALPLEHICSMASERTLQVLGVQVARAGNVLHVNNAKVEVAEACDGLRMLTGLMLVMATFAFITPMRRWARITCLAISPFMAVLCNIIRLIPTVWVFGTFPHAFAETFHNVAGWFMLPLAFLLLWVLLRVLRWAAVPVSPFGLAYV